VIDIEDVYHPPSGGRVKLLLLGILFPAVITHFGMQAWITEESPWYYQPYSAYIEHGQSAKALGLTYMSIGLFAHARWFWGLLPFYPFYILGTMASFIGFSGGLFWFTFFA
jgi:hypothetical protein